MVTSWCMPYGQLKWLSDYDDKLARQFFNTATSFVVANNPFPGYACTVLPLFASFDAYARAGSTMQGGWVCYDPEHWAKTPMLEQRKPKAFMSAFASLADARGQKLVAAPGRDLVYVPGCDDPWMWPEKINDAYLRTGIPAAAREADILLCQSQGSEKDLDAYNALLAGAANQQPDGQILWAGLTTNFATAAQMTLACQEYPCAGYFVTIAAQDQVKTCADFFRSL
jgi:hypothetical protein